MDLLKPTALALISASILGCASEMSGPESGASPAASGQAHHAELVITGTLVRKGSEIDSWWALVEDSGKTWRLQLPPGTNTDQFFKAQNTRVQVTGTQGEPFLSASMMLFKGMRPLASSR